MSLSLILAFLGTTIIVLLPNCFPNRRSQPLKLDD